jgi:creatinine amidohydrolase/Fe(II)-dependent formamide hydrolase-like protein
VRGDLIAGAGAGAGPQPAPASIDALIFDRGVTWPWRSDDPRLARMGIIGDPAAASAERGRAMVDGMIEEARAVFVRLLENQSVMRKR